MQALCNGKDYCLASRVYFFDCSFVEACTESFLHPSSAARHLRAVARAIGPRVQTAMTKKKKRKKKKGRAHAVYTAAFTSQHSTKICVQVVTYQSFHVAALAPALVGVLWPRYNGNKLPSVAWKRVRSQQVLFPSSLLPGTNWALATPMTRSAEIDGDQSPLGSREMDRKKKKVLKRANNLRFVLWFSVSFVLVIS